MATVVLPDPSLVLLVGAAGSGKSTFAARHFGADEVLSSDAMRARLSGDEADQRVSRAAFAIIDDTLERRMQAGLLTVIDATNADRRHRRSLLDRAEAVNVPAVALVLALPARTVLERNARRARRVDEQVVRRHLARVRAALLPEGLAAEGYATIWVGRSPKEIDAVTIERVRTR